MHQDDELLQEIVLRWSEVHKKSMTTYLILLALQEKQMWSKEIELWLIEKTSWDFTEKSLYRTLRRMTHSGMIGFEKTKAERTGAERKQYRLTTLGGKVLEQITQEVLGYLTKI